MKVSAIMTTDLVVTSPETTLDDAIKLMDENRVRHLPVMDGKRLVGVLSDRALLEATGWLPSRVLEVFGNPDRKQTVEEVMHSPPVTVAPDVSVTSACLDLLGRSIGCLPVVSDSELVGILSEMDVLALFIRHSGGGLYDRGIANCMTKGTTSVSETATLEATAELMVSLGVRHLPVMQDGRLLGMLSDRDLQRGVGCGRNAETAVEEVMSKALITIDSDGSLSDAAGLMAKHRISALPVVDDCQYFGILSLSDVLDTCLDCLREPEGLELA